MLLVLSGCGGSDDAPPAAPFTQANRADVVLIGSPAAFAGGRTGRTAADWMNLICHRYGPVRVIPPDAPADLYSTCRVVVIPPEHADDERLVAATAGLIERGGHLLVDLAGDPGPRRRWAARAESAPHPGQVMLIDAGGGLGPAREALRRLPSLPGLDTTPAGWDAFRLPAVAVTGESAARLAEGAQERNVRATAYVSPQDADVGNLERIRRAGWEIGLRLDPALAALGEGARGKIDEARGALARLGALEEETASAFIEAAPGPELLTAAAAAGVERLTAPVPGEELPRQARAADGRLLPLLVFPRPDPPLADADWIERAERERDSVWVTRVDAYARFWEARARSTLGSSWSGTRLRIECDAAVARLALLVPVEVEGLALREVLHEGASAVGDVVERDDRAYIRVRLKEGANVVWGIYEETNPG